MLLRGLRLDLRNLSHGPMQPAVPFFLPQHSRQDALNATFLFLQALDLTSTMTLILILALALQFPVAHRLSLTVSLTLINPRTLTPSLTSWQGTMLLLLLLLFLLLPLLLLALLSLLLLLVLLLHLLLLLRLLLGALLLLSLPMLVPWAVRLIC